MSNVNMLDVNDNALQGLRALIAIMENGGEITTPELMKSLGVSVGVARRIGNALVICELTEITDKNEENARIYRLNYQRLIDLMQNVASKLREKANSQLQLANLLEFQTENETKEKWTGNQSKEFREEMGISQGELAEKLGISRSYVAQFENGLKKIPQELVTILNDTKSNIYNLLKN